MHATLDSTDVAILERAFRPEAGGWSRAAAEAMLSVGFDPADRERMIDLLDQAKVGTLTPADAAALESYRRIGRMFELMKSKARRSLGSTNPSSAA